MQTLKTIVITAAATLGASTVAFAGVSAVTNAGSAATPVQAIAAHGGQAQTIGPVAQRQSHYSTAAVKAKAEHRQRHVVRQHADAHHVAADHRVRTVAARLLVSTNQTKGPQSCDPTCRRTRDRVCDPAVARTCTRTEAASHGCGGGCGN